MIPFSRVSRINVDASLTYVLVEVPLIAEASLKLDLLESSSLPGIDKDAAILIKQLKPFLCPVGTWYFKKKICILVVIEKVVKILLKNILEPGSRALSAEIDRECASS